MLSSRRSPGSLASLLALTLAATGCGDNAADTNSAPAFDGDSCEMSFEARVSRSGKQDMARLSYACAADLCDPSEPFAAGATVLVAIDLPTDSASALEVVSNTPDIVGAELLQASYDACLGQTRAYVTLSAKAAGDATLLVRAEGLVDELSVQVARAAAVSLQVSPLSQLAFTKDREAQTQAGEPLLVVPSLVAADGSALIGMPELTWRVDDTSIASVREQPSTEDERFLRDLAAAHAVFLDGKKAGVAKLEVETADGARGELRVRIMEP